LPYHGQLGSYQSSVGLVPINALAVIDGPIPGLSATPKLAMMHLGAGLLLDWEVIQSPPPPALESAETFAWNADCSKHL
jgi:hypothetical protein